MLLTTFCRKHNIPIKRLNKWIYVADESKFKRVFKHNRLRNAKALMMHLRQPNLNDMIGPHFKTCVKIGNKVLLNNITGGITQ